MKYQTSKLEIFKLNPGADDEDDEDVTVQVQLPSHHGDCNYPLRFKVADNSSARIWNHQPILLYLKCPE